jgi:hypothetical protein
MSDQTSTVQGGFSGDPQAALNTGAGGCCGAAAVQTAPKPEVAAAPCCGTSQEASEAGSCCGSEAKAEAVASGAGCCG